MASHDKCATAVFTRVPVPGATKTRLQKRIDPSTCAELHKAMLLDLVERISPACGEGCAMRALAQEGEGLGSRMSNALNSLFAQGAEKCLIIGSDTPDVSASDIDCARSALDLLISGSVEAGPRTTRVIASIQSC